jgi:hypothetical protein
VTLLDRAALPARSSAEAKFGCPRLFLRSKHKTRAGVTVIVCDVGGGGRWTNS